MHDLTVPTSYRHIWLAIGWLMLMTCACSPTASPPSAPPQLTQLTFGHRQVNQLLSDRPNMRGILDKEHPVRKWIVAGFNGERVGHRVYWNADSPKSGRGAEHAPRYHHYPAQLYITGGTEETSLEKWAGVVYEFFNLEHSEQFEKLRDQALAGKISSEDFALQCVKVEFSALKKTEEFFRENPLPSSIQGRHEWYDWVLHGVGSFEDYAEKFKYHAGPGNYDYFKNEFDEQIAPWIGKMPKQSQDAGDD